MKWQGKIGFLMFLLVILGGMALTHGTAKAQGNIERQQAVEIATDYIHASEAQERSDAFNVEIIPKAEDALVPEVLADKPTGWMRSMAIADMSRMMCGQMGITRPTYPSTWWDATRAFETTGGRYPQIPTAAIHEDNPLAPTTPLPPLIRGNKGEAERSEQMGPMMMGSGMHWTYEKDPSVAALLSLQPMPVALGNFYTDDWEKGIIYTTLEVGMFISGMVLLSDRYSDHFHGGYTRNSWTDTERTWLISLVTGYVVVKVISAFDAAYSAERYIRRGEKKGGDLR